MMWLNSCPSCQTGDLYLDEDSSGHCMQCGHIQHQVRGNGRLVDVLQALGSDGPSAPESVRRLEHAQSVAI